MPSAIEKINVNIPLVDLRLQYHQLKDELLEALSGLMENQNFIKGPALAAFEKSFAEYHGVKHALGVNSGTDALYLIFKALGIKPGDEIITVPLTFAATGETILRAGATLKYVDVDPARFTMDPSKLEAAITSRTVGIVPVHLYGTPADLDAILRTAHKHGFWVVEDTCQAHGALYKGKKAGTFGIASAFSFYPSKNLGAYGDGGAVITNDDEIAQKIDVLRDHGQTRRYYSEIPGVNSRLDALQAAILSVKLSHLDAWNQKRREVATWYREALDGIKGIELPARFPECREVYHLFVIRTSERESLAKHLDKAGISTGAHYNFSLHEQPAFKSQNSYPVSEKLSREVMSLPMYPELSKKEVQYIAETIRSYFG